MRFIIVLFIFLVIFEISCEKYIPEYTRTKRAKYYSSPPQRYYRRPPISYPSNGAFSYTPPPGYMVEDQEARPENSPPRPYMVSKRPFNEGLSDEDIRNMIKYLSKQDLNKIVEFAAENDRRSPSKYKDIDNIRNYKDLSERHVYDNPSIGDQDDFSERLVKKREDTSVYKENKNNKFSINGPYVQGQKVDKQYVIEYANKENYIRMTTPRNIIYATPSNNPYSQLHEPESSNPFNFVNQYISHELSASSDVPSDNVTPLRDPKMSEFENNLPRPVNLREEPEYEISYSNNVPAISHADSSNYKVENFGNLPLMDYNSKLHTVSSYDVPHYIVTSPRPQPQQYGPQKSPPLEVAPPPSAAQAQSDAHLKVIKIWTHKSRGTAYTLNNDGTLSLERPQRTKPMYGYP